jgi:hypothetical protein
MTAAARKAFDSVVHFFSLHTWNRGGGSAEPKADESQPMVGKYYADYSAIPREQLDAVQPELDELFKNSKVVSVKRDL